MSQTSISIDELRELLITCAGGDDALQGDLTHASFDELGFDSLALIDTASKLKRDYGVLIPDEQLLELHGPTELLTAVNEQIAGQPANRT
ncbi:phosphopantetheine-binding protein [Dactylosporangium sp. NPDC049525]|uniref:phosphopantetheine-binding protein n=1 Tax=Dactylosporangium sp. NPDC049525 TaxID=3154730 RepID=UPI00343A5634